MRTELTRRLQGMGWLLRKCGPYLALEILLPGGTLFALLLFFYQRRQAAVEAGAPPVPLGRALRQAAGDLLATGAEVLRGGLRALGQVRATV